MQIFAEGLSCFYFSSIFVLIPFTLGYIHPHRLCHPSMSLEYLCHLEAAARFLPLQFSRSRVAFIFMQFTCQLAQFCFLCGCQLATCNCQLVATTNFGKRGTRNNICHIWHDGNYFRVFSTSHTGTVYLPITLSIPLSFSVFPCLTLCLSLYLCLRLSLYLFLCLSPWLWVHFLRWRTSVQKCWFLATWK